MLKSVTDPAGRVFSYTYNSSKQLTKRSFTLDSTPTYWTEQFAYTSGLLTGITDGNGKQTVLEYTSSRITKVTTPIATIYSTYSYDDADHTTTVANQLGQGTVYSYNASNGLVGTITNPLGHDTNYSYDSASYLVTGTSFVNHNPVDNSDTTVEYSYTYDSNGNLTLMIDPLGHRTAYEYNSLNEVTYQRVKDTDNTTDYAVTHYVYDANGNLTSETDPLGRTTTNTYYSNGLLYTSTDNFNKTTTYTYNSHGWSTITQDPKGKTTKTYYDELGNAIYTKDAEGNMTRYDYDALGRSIKTYQAMDSVSETDPASADWNSDPAEIREYDLNGNVTHKTSTDDVVTDYEYDELNRQTSQAVDPTGKNAVSTTAYTYENGDFLQKMTDEVSNVTKRYTNSAGYLVKTVGNNTTVNYTYDNVGNQVRSLDDEGRETITKYDKLNRQTDGYEDPSGKNIHSTYEYDLLGRVTTQNDGQGNATTSVYDLVGRPTSVTITKNGVDHITTYSYDQIVTEGSSQYIVNTVTDEDGSKSTYTDAAGNTYKEVNTLTGGTTFSYEYGSTGSIISIKVGTTNARELVANTYDNSTGLELLTQVTYGNGDYKQYSYNDTGKLASEKYESDSTSRFEYGYDTLGNLSSIKDHHRNVETRYTYDDGSRITGVSEGAIDFTTPNHSYTITYTGNNVTNISETTNGATNAIAYAYDGDNNITNATFGYGNNNTAKVQWGYDTDNRETSRTVYDDETTPIFETNKTYTESTYATAYVQTIRNHRLGQSGYDTKLTYTYDANHNITSVSDETNETSYLYDAKEQLVRENNQAAGKTWTWDYDNGGNITTKKEYSYTAPNQTLGTPVSTISYTYDDAKGWTDMLTSYDGNSITYDDSGNPLSDGTWTYTWEGGRNLVGLSKTGTTVTYTYNKDGIRTAKTVNGVTTSYNLKGDLVTSETTGTDTIYYRYNSKDKDKLISMNCGDVEYYYFYDAQGDVLGLFDRSGSVVVEYTYDAWGNNLSTTGSLASTVGVKNPYRYRSYRFDIETGLYYLQSRYYNPNFDRFINSDDINNLYYNKEFYRYKNLYNYCSNSPENRSDADGNVDWSVFSLKSDWAGRTILWRWLFGSGSELTIVNDNSWTSYMEKDYILRPKVRDIVFPLCRKIANGQQKHIKLRTHMVIENGEDIIGYQYLHGTNADYGDFSIEGTIGMHLGCMWSSLEFCWNDRIDPNFQYTSDKAKYNYAKSIPGATCKNYTIRISWSDKSDQHQGIGWLMSGLK